MNISCTQCGAGLPPGGEAYLCPCGRMYCGACASVTRGTCPSCNLELKLDPSRPGFVASSTTLHHHEDTWGNRPWLIWAGSFGVWTLVALATGGESYEWWRSRGFPMSLWIVFAAEICRTLSYAPLTPFVVRLATRFDFERKNWLKRVLLHLPFGFAFSIAHVTLQGITPFAVWDPQIERFVSGIWNSQTHMFEFHWHIFDNLFRSNAVEDITSAYVPIVLVAHVLTYYRKLRDRDLHAAKLETQLVKSHLETLQSHLQPHFLFNTLHSISALMLTDVKAADRMIARLSDLLRMTLASQGIQITSLRRELELVDVYLEIEKIRLGERLKVHLDIPSDAVDAAVPSLLLQPLVENAIKHGVSRLSFCGNVWISANREGPDLYVRVRDDGPGLVKDVNGSFKGGIGLGSTRERLCTLYGDHQSLELYGGPNGGAEVCVRIPFRAEPQILEDITALKAE